HRLRRQALRARADRQPPQESRRRDRTRPGLALHDTQRTARRAVTTSERVRVLIVDDSALMRKLLADLLRTEPGIDVVGTSRDGFEAIEMAGRLKPAVVTLDVEMPGMSGLEALPALLEAHEVPVLMVSALTQEGAAVTLEALELGAVDFMPKPDRHQLA